MVNTLFDLPDANPKHPAKYTDALLSEFVKSLRGKASVLDPFAGTGKIFLLRRWFPAIKIVGVEIERDWARSNKRIVNANALYLPFSNSSFDSICTSPTYGNRMADHDKGTVALGWEFRKTYASALYRQLHPDNSGSLQWGEDYRCFHIQAWTECVRVLKPGGVFVVNIKNHIRAGTEQLVTEWHVETLLTMGLSLINHVHIKTPSKRHGQNSDLRVPYESVVTFSK
jgi:tRNA G10  N-methylase Trm11